MRKLFLYSIAVLATIGIFNACSQFDDFKEIDEVDFEPSIAVPILHSSLSIQEILDEDDDLSFLDVERDGQLLFNYETDPTSVNSDELLNTLPDFPFPILEPSVKIPFNIWTAGNVRFLDAKNGTVQFRMTSNYSEDVSVTVRIPDLKKNGVSFEQEATIQFDGNSPSETTTAAINIAGYTLEVISDSITLEYEASMNGQPVEVQSIVGQANNWSFSNIKGYLDAKAFDVEEDTIDIELYDNWKDGSLTFEDPRLVLTIDNSFGFPASATINSMKAITVDGREIAFTSDLPNNRLDVGSPGLNEVGGQVNNVFIFTKDNSNIDEILNAQPRRFIYNVGVRLNPDGTQNVMGFIDENSTVDTKVRIEMPIYGAASGFEIESASELDMGDTEKVTEAAFRLIADNGIPVELAMQLYFTNQADVIVDSLFDTRKVLIPAGQVDANGNVTESTKVTTDIPISSVKLERMRTYKDIITTAVISTSNNGQSSVRVNSNQTLDISLGGIFTVDPE